MNNNSIGKDVYFDDIKIEHYTGTILEENHYYPFGLTLTSTAAGTAAPNPYKYQGIELEKNFGLEQYETAYRGLDPQLGRFIQIDPMAEASLYQSPYASMDNNPASNTDPDGLFSRFGAWWRNIAWDGDGTFKNNKTGEWGVRTSGEDWDGSFMSQITYKGSPQAFPSQIKEHLREQMEFEDAMQQTGIETKWVDNVGEARKDMLNFSASLMINSAPQLNAAKAAGAAATVSEGAAKTSTSGLKTFGSLTEKFGEGYKSIAATQGKHLPVQLGQKLNTMSPGSWSKVYEAGILNGSKVETHYFFNSTTGQYVNPFIKSSDWGRTFRGVTGY